MFCLIQRLHSTGSPEGTLDWLPCGIRGNPFSAVALQWVVFETTALGTLTSSFCQFFLSDVRGIALTMSDIS